MKTIGKLKEFFYAHKFFLIGLIVLSWVVWINRFPEGHVIVGGDNWQLINPQENFWRIFYDWQGRLSVFYASFYLLDALGISDTWHLSFYLAFFLFGSYFSCYLFVRMVFPGTSRWMQFLVSLFYALNIYTLYVFSYSWGYSHYQSIYIFIPLLAGLYYKLLTTRENKYLWLFSLVLFVGSSGFGNPAFALALGLFLLLLTIFFWLTGVATFDKKAIIKLASLATVSLFVNAYWILPIIPQVKGGVDDLFNNNPIDLDWWLRHTSNPLIDTLRLAQYNNWYFPDNFPYRALYEHREIFIAATLVPIGLIVFGLTRRMEDQHKKLFVSFVAVFLLLATFVGKVRPPFEVINSYFYHIWGFNTLRSYEKIAIFTPFLIAALLHLVMVMFDKMKYKWAGTFLMIVVLLTPLPFYLGKLQQNMSAVFVRDTVMLEAKDYRNSKYSFLVKIPEEYYQIKDAVSQDSGSSKISMLPYSVVDSLGWSNYPAWKLDGVDVTQYLFPNDFIETNRYNFGDWLFAKEFNESPENPEWILKVFGMMNVKYIVYHKDVEPEFVSAIQDKIDILKEGGLIHPIIDNQYYTLFQIKNDYVMPRVFWEKDSFACEAAYGAVDPCFASTKGGLEEASFQMINPTKYAVELGIQNFGSKSIVLNEFSSNNWEASIVTNEGEKLRLKERYAAMGFANGWKLSPDNMAQRGKIVIEYIPMKWAYRGMLITGLMLVIITFSLVKPFYESRKIGG